MRYPKTRLNLTKLTSVILLASMAALLVAPGCKAIQGIGRDVQSVAHEGQDFIDGK